MELAHPLLLCHSAKVFKSPLQVVSFSPDMGSIHPPSPRRGGGKTEPLCKACASPDSGSWAQRPPGERGELL